MNDERWHVRSRRTSGALALALLAWTGAVFPGSLEAQGAPSAGPAKLRSQQAAYEIRADVLVDALLDQLRTQVVEESRLRQRILAEPDQHVRSSESQAVLLAWSRSELEAFYDRQLVEIHRRINRDHPAEVIRLDWLRDRAEKRRPGQKEQAKGEALQSFDSNFSRARREVVARQWLDLEPQVALLIPAAAEIEQIAAGGQRDLRPLRLRLEARLRAMQSFPWRGREGSWALFEENQARIGQALGERLDRGLAELAAQREILVRAEVPGTLKETLELRLRQRLDEHLKRFKGSGFGIFPSVAAWIPRRAAELMEARLTESVGKDLVCQELPDERLQGLIVANLPRHVEYERSSEALRRELPTAIRGDLIRHTLEKSGEAAGSAPRLARLLEETRWASLLSRSVAECLSGSLERVRGNLALQQVERRFPNLRAKALPEKTILHHRASPNDPATQRLHAVGISLAPTPEPLLQEAQAELVKKADGLLQEGASTMDQQLSLAESGSSRNLINELRQAGQSQAAVLQRVKSSVLTDWRGQQQQSDNVGARKYPGLFHSTESRLEELVKDSFTRPIVKPVPAEPVQPQGPSDARPGENGGGEGTGGGVGGGEGSGVGSGSGNSGGGGGGDGCTESEPRVEIREVPHDRLKEILLGTILCVIAFMAGRSVRR